MIVPNDNRPLVPARLVLGIVTFVLGALFLADSADLLRADSALAFWPVGLVALGLVVVLQPDTANRMVGAVLLVAGVWLLLNAVGVWSYRFWYTWPYLLIVFGAWLIYRARQMWERQDGDERVAAFAFLDVVARQATGAPFEAGEFSAVGGECRIDLCQAQASEQTGDVVIDAFALFGRIDLHVPARWRVDNRVLPLLGRVNDTSRQPTTLGPTVVVQGSAICGSVSVTSGD